MLVVIKAVADTVGRAVDQQRPPDIRRAINRRAPSAVALESLSAGNSREFDGKELRAIARARVDPQPVVGEHLCKGKIPCRGLAAFSQQLVSAFAIKTVVYGERFLDFRQEAPRVLARRHVEALAFVAARLVFRKRRNPEQRVSNERTPMRSSCRDEDADVPQTASILPPS